MTINELGHLVKSKDDAEVEARDNIANSLLTWIYVQAFSQGKEDIFDVDVSPSDLTDILYESMREYND